MSNEIDSWLSGFFNLNPDAIPEEETVKTKAYKNDLFGDVLPALDRRDIKYYSRLTDEQKKDIAVWPLTRWMSSVVNNAADQLYTVNEVVNKDANALDSTKHKELQWMLLAISGSGKREKHVWPGAPKGATKSSLQETMLNLYPLLKYDDIELLLQINTREEIEDFFKENGYDDKTIKEIFKGEPKGK